MSFRFDDVMKPTRVATQEEILALRQKYSSTSVGSYKDKGQVTFDFSSEMSFEDADYDLSQSFVAPTLSDNVLVLEYNEPINISGTDTYVAGLSEVLVA